MNSLTLRAHAKINLLLAVTGKRPDGYHTLYTLFHRISLSDTLKLQKAPRGIFQLNCSNGELSTGEDNLVTKAYRLLQKKFPELGGVRVRLQKRIPMGAGLGGGSSNAATMLLGMKKLYGLKLSFKELVKMGKQLGADVPFFLYETRLAVGVGRGDEIRVLDCPWRAWFLLEISRQGLATKAVYHEFRRPVRPPSLTKLRGAVRLLSDFFKEKKISRLAGLLRNDLEEPAFRLRPSLRKDRANMVRKGAVAARMTGSGPTLFAVCDHLKAAKSLAGKLKQSQPSKQWIVCHSL